jgi:DNA-binding NarL/FixJ family response regulator
LSIFNPHKTTLFQTVESSSKNIRIGLVEDNRVNQNSFLQKIKQFPQLDLSLIASSGQEFLEKIKGIPHDHLPSVVFMDIQMPGLNGIETIKLAKAHSLSIHYIVLTVFEDEDNIFEAIRAGASGYLLKHEDYFSINEAIEEVLNFGGAPMSPAVARKTLMLLGKPQSDTNSNQATLIDTLLTERERMVLVNLVNGYDAKRIGEIISISTLTVRKHIANIYTKLHVNSKAQVISLAHQNKWVK